jgi:hypothetical protein
VEIIAHGVNHAEIKNSPVIEITGSCPDKFLLQLVMVAKTGVNHFAYSILIEYMRAYLGRYPSIRCWLALSHEIGRDKPVARGNRGPVMVCDIPFYCSVVGELIDT